jgi:GNAT superfamily N-acetyltransferase
MEKENFMEFGVREGNIVAKGKRFTVEKDGKEIARAHLYIMHNNLHKRPFGLMEDVYVDEEFRGQGIGTKLVKRLVEVAEEEDCYKLIATSRYERPRVHELYEELAFDNHGIEFRMNFSGDEE